MKLNIVIFGLSITSSWGNGHASTYRALIKALARRGHRVTFLERDQPWYRENRDLPNPPYCRTRIYNSLADAAARFGPLIAEADLVVLGSYVPDAPALGDWITSEASGVTAFYDIDTPVTLSKLAQDNAGYINAALIPRFDLYLSFTGGPALTVLEERYGSPRARALYCSVDPALHAITTQPERWLLGYLGTYSADRQPQLESLLLDVARRLPSEKFVVVGAQYPSTGIRWPANVERIEHLPPAKHAQFYAAQRFTLNITRADMRALGYSPSVRLFEAAACGVPIITDPWPGIDEFFDPGREILIAENGAEVERIIRDTDEQQRRGIAEAAFRRVGRQHTASKRAAQLESYYEETLRSRRRLGQAEAVA